MQKKRSWNRKLLVWTLTLAFLMGLPALASAAPGYPVLQRGAAGDEVVALQYLLRGWVDRGLPVTGYFGSQTQRAVQQLQRDHGLWVDGIAGAGTWSTMIPALGWGDRGEGVKALQSLLRARGAGSLAVDGVFGARTYEALLQFQKNWGLTPNGIAGTNTWTSLLGGYSPQGDPVSGFVQLPAQGVGYYSYSDPRGSWGRPDVVQTLIDIGRQWQARHPDVPPVAVGDISVRQGGYFYPHASHQQGRDVDLGIMIDNDWNYSRYLTQELVNMFWATGKVEIIFFNDPQVQGVMYWPNHDTHFHVRFW